MSKTLGHIKCLISACEELGIAYSTFDKNGNLLSVQMKRPHYFVNYSLPFCDDGVCRVCNDKDFTYQLLKDCIRMPKTHGFFDPNYRDKKYEMHVKENSSEKIADTILSEFELPVIVKMNTGSKGQNVFLCESKEKIIESVDSIYDKQTTKYDYIALGQEYIKPKHEYRVLVLNKEIVLVYEKDISNATFTGNLSPLHYENAKAIHVTDPALIKRLTDFIQPVYEKLDLEFGGLDILENENGELYLLEINIKPGFDYFLRDNGEKPLIEMYKKVLQRLIELEK